TRYKSDLLLDLLLFAARLLFTAVVLVASRSTAGRCAPGTSVSEAEHRTTDVCWPPSPARFQAGPFAMLFARHPPDRASPAIPTAAVGDASRQRRRGAGTT